MDYGQIDLTQLAASLASSPNEAWVQIVAGPATQGVAPLWRAEITVGEPMPDWNAQLWRYETCTFASGRMAASELAGVLVAGNPLRISAGGAGFEFSTNQTFVNFHHRPSFAQHDPRPVAWPSYEYTIGLDQGPRGQFQPPGQMLVGPGAPSFVTFGVAYNAFFYDNYTLTGSSNPALGMMILKVLDMRGRICRVSVQPTHLDIEVECPSVNGASLELMATSDRASAPVDGHADHQLQLPNGLPNDAWLWLRTNSEWLDYRSLGGWAAYRSPDVHDERTPETAPDLSAIIALGENQHVEFKRQLPGNTPASRQTVFKTIVAFANGDGGTMLFGVDDDGTIPGIKDGAGSAADSFFNSLRASTSPTPMCHAQEETINGVRVLKVDVEANAGLIHGVTVLADKTEYFVRRGATTFHARPEELQATVSTRPNAEQAWPPWK